MKGKASFYRRLYGRLHQLKKLNSKKHIRLTRIHVESRHHLTHTNGVGQAAGGGADRRADRLRTAEGGDPVSLSQEYLLSLREKTGKGTKVCKIICGRANWQLWVDGETITFYTRSAADYFLVHYTELGYKVQMIDEPQPYGLGGSG